MKLKVLQVALWSIWLAGVMLIVLSIYATHKLPTFNRGRTDNLKFDHFSPKIAIFTAPRPFTGAVGSRQSLAIRSWLRLSPQITVVLFSQHPSAADFAGNFGSRVLFEPNIDFTFLGTPFFHSMVASAWTFASDIYVLIDPETILLHDFVSTLHYAYKIDRGWLLVASTRNASYFPFHLSDDGKHWLMKDGKRVRTEEEILVRSEMWNLCEGKMLIAWNSGELPLHSGVLPPFLYGKGTHNAWVINEASSSEIRFLFDASWSISSFFLNDAEHVSNMSGRVSHISDAEKRSWEYVGNSLLGTLYGSSVFHETNYSSLAKLLNCNGQYHFVDMKENIVDPVNNERLGSWKGKIFSSWRLGKSMACIDRIKSTNTTLGCSFSDQFKSLAPLDFPFSLKSLLSVTADKNKTIVLAIAGYSYRDMLMSWVCRLRHLRVTNFIVCALDHETYQFSVLQGLPVFNDPTAPSNISFNDCHFGTKCFQRVTKVKSRLVLQILKLGYNVLLSDVDVYWFRNPLPLLYSFGPSVLAAQSDEYNITGAINLPRRLNSGFYFARSDISTIAAMEKVVKHAATSGLSEQPSFYDTLCGEESYSLPAMLQSCAQLLWLGKQKDRNFSRNKEHGGASISLDISVRSKDIYVRIIHAGGREELYENAVAVSQMVEKYPGMCVARPEVFKKPHESFLGPDENLLPGHKYYMIPTTTAKKLKRNSAGKIRVNGPAGGDESEPRITWDASKDDMDESVSSAKDFFVSKEKSSRCLKKRVVRGKKPFVPPLPKARIYSGSGWEPSLTSVQEVSP